MNTCFNKLAAALALLDTAYIIFRLLDTLRRKLQLNGIFLVFHAFVTYPIMNVLLFSLVLIPITLAYERYQSIKYVNTFYYFSSLWFLSKLKHFRVLSR